VSTLRCSQVDVCQVRHLSWSVLWIAWFPFIDGVRLPTHFCHCEDEFIELGQCALWHVALWAIKYGLWPSYGSVRATGLWLVFITNPFFFGREPHCQVE
jgi:hypothetical protein